MDRRKIQNSLSAAVENQTTNLLYGLMEILNKLGVKLDNIGTERSQNMVKAPTRSPPTCWQCGEIEHVRSKCPTNTNDRPKTPN